MLNVLFAYKTFDDILEHDNEEEQIKILAENMLFITRDFTNDTGGLTIFGQELISDYFEKVPETLRAAVFIEYINQLNKSDEGFNIGIIMHQAKS